MKTTTTTVTHTCDRCKVSVEGSRDLKPSTEADPWSYLKIDQDAGWDGSGAPWCPRMREKLLLCGACTEQIIRMINGFVIRFDAPPGPESGRFIETEDLTGRGIKVGEWRDEGDDCLLSFGLPHEAVAGIES